MILSIELITMCRVFHLSTFHAVDFVCELSPAISFINSKKALCSPLVPLIDSMNLSDLKSF